MIINKTIDFKSIYLLQPIQITQNSYHINFKIKTDNGKEPVLLQTPKLFIPFGLNKYKFNMNVETSLLIHEPKKEFKEFYISIKKLDRIVKKMKNKNSLLRDKQFVSCIKPEVDIFPERLIINVSNTTTVFDLNRNEIDINKISKKTSGKFILHLSNIWINQNSFGYNLEAIQTIIDPKLIIKEFSFIEEEPNNEYNKYFKMLSFGVPKEAVIKKMELEGINPNVLDKKPIPSTLPPPPPLPKLLLGNNKSNLNKNLLLEIKKSVKLKKTELIKKDTFEDARIPSLDQISNALANLKKIN